MIARRLQQKKLPRKGVAAGNGITVRTALEKHPDGSFPVELSPLKWKKSG